MALHRHYSRGREHNYSELKMTKKLGRPSKAEPHKSTNIYMYKRQYEWLNKKAFDTRTSMSYILQTLMDEAMEKDRREKKDDQRRNERGMEAFS